FRSALFFFSSRRRHASSKRDWSSDVCSSDLKADQAVRGSGPRSLGSEGCRCADGTRSVLGTALDVFAFPDYASTHSRRCIVNEESIEAAVAKLNGGGL